MPILKGTTVVSAGVCFALALGGCASTTDDPAESEALALEEQAAPQDEQASEANPATEQVTPQSVQSEQGTEENVGTTKEGIIVGPYGGAWATPGLGWGGGLGWGRVGWGGWGVPGYGWGMGYPGNINGGFNQWGPF